METIVIDGNLMTSRKAAHDLLAACLAFPPHYGRNLDALYDLLTERGKSTRLVLLHRGELEELLGKYGAALLETLEDAARANPALHLLYELDE